MAFQFMACRGLGSSLFIFFVIFGGASVFLFSWFSGRAFGQESDSKTTHSSVRERDGDRPYLRDRLDWNWNQRDRTLPRGESAAGVSGLQPEDGNAGRARGCECEFYIPRCVVLYIPSQVELGWGTRFSSGSIVWAPVGPTPLASDATGDGAQDYNWLSGRAISILIDPADTTGNTVLLGGAYGGLWKSTNAGSQNSNPALVTWQALINDQPTLAVGAIALQPGNSNVVLVGAGNSWPAGVTQKQFAATVNNSSNQSLTWAVTGGSANGTVDGTGLYTTPAVVPNPAAVKVTATAAADSIKSGSGTVSVETPTGLGTSQITVTATAAGGTAHGDLVTLIVQLGAIHRRDAESAEKKLFVG